MFCLPRFSPEEVIAEYQRGHLRSNPQLVSQLISSSSVKTITTAAGVKIIAVVCGSGPTEKCFLPECREHVKSFVTIPLRIIKTATGHELHGWGQYCSYECALTELTTNPTRYPTTSTTILQNLFTSSYPGHVLHARKSYLLRDDYGGPLNTIDWSKDSHSYVPLPGITVKLSERLFQRQQQEIVAAALQPKTDTN